MDEREKQRQQRDFDLLKHVSTLDVATIVLVLAVPEAFAPPTQRPEPTGLPLFALILFFLSLLCAMVGLFVYVWIGWTAGRGVRYLTIISCLLFLGGLGAAFNFAYQLF
jgi:hypothetical protein